MAKLIGTGRDPRFIKGADYDVPEHEVEHHVKAGLGKPVDPAAEPEAIHPGEKIIKEDPQHDAEREQAVEQGDPAGTGQVAARVESTASPQRGKKKSD